jgi:hypothetical protein
MSDNPVPPPKPPARRPVTAAPKPKVKPKPVEIDHAHVPMSEEFDRAKWTLPPVGIVLIAMAIVAVVVVILGYANRAKPVAAGAINGATAVQLQDNTVLAAIQLNVANVTEKPWFIRSVKATVKTDQGEFSDDAATAVDSQRYFQAFPTLGEGATPILKFDQKIPAGQNQLGTIVVAFPITKDQFDARKSLTVTIDPFDNRPVTLTK